MKESPLRLVLASGSPRRKDLLDSLGLAFTVRPVDIDESPLPGEVPEVYVERLAREKAEAQGAPGEVILAADTIVAQDGALLGKPGAGETARRMLRRLQGRRHSVSTGVALYDPAAGTTLASVTTAEVLFAPMSDAEIQWYIDTGEPMDKAGAYAIQGVGGLFVDAVDGNYHTIVGLPLTATARLFREAGRDLLDFQE